MNENHHALAAGSILSGDKAWTVGWETADAQHLAAHIEASVEATLALAYEQRTANLIAMWSNPQASMGNVVWSMGEETAGQFLQEILERLGVKP